MAVGATKTESIRVKLLRYGPKGREKPALVDETGQVRDLSGELTDLSGGALTASGLETIRAIEPRSLPVVGDPGRLGPCIGHTGKIICIGLNYSDHAAESGMDVPDEPVIFFKATSAITGPEDEVLLPPGSKKSDWEVELGVVIGDEARYVSEDDALEHVAGYCVVNDLSERHYQLERCGVAARACRSAMRRG
jgi:ureidoglycolate lyase